MTSNQMLLDVFTTALEGGIGYWSACSEYRWQKSEPGSGGTRMIEDTENFYAVIHDVEDDDKQYRIDRDVIKKGIAWLKEHPLGNPYHRLAVLDLASGNEDVDYDADTADAIVQAGLFGELVYG